MSRDFEEFVELTFTSNPDGSMNVGDLFGNAGTRYKKYESYEGGVVLVDEHAGKRAGFRRRIDPDGRVVYVRDDTLKYRRTDELNMGDYWATHYVPGGTTPGGHAGGRTTSPDGDSGGGAIVLIAILFIGAALASVLFPNGLFAKSDASVSFVDKRDGSKYVVMEVGETKEIAVESPDPKGITIAKFGKEGSRCLSIGEHRKEKEEDGKTTTYYFSVTAKEPTKDGIKASLMTTSCSTNGFGHNDVDFLDVIVE